MKGVQQTKKRIVRSFKESDVRTILNKINSYICCRKNGETKSRKPYWSIILELYCLYKMLINILIWVWFKTKHILYGVNFAWVFIISIVTLSFYGKINK